MRMPDVFYINIIFTYLPCEKKKENKLSATSTNISIFQELTSENKIKIRHKKQISTETKQRNTRKICLRIEIVGRH